MTNEATPAPAGMTRLIRKGVLRLLLLTSVCMPAAVAQDVVIFRNGDRLTGKVMRLEAGELYFKSPPIRGTMQIGWNRIERVESVRRFEVELVSGERRSGLLDNTTREDEEVSESLQLRQGDSQEEVPLKEVARMVPLLDRFGGQFEAKADFGFSFATANDQVSYSLNGNVDYERTLYSITGSVQSLINTQQNAEDTNRHNIDAYLSRKFKPKWSFFSLNNLFTSKQQQIDLRTSFGGGVGRNVYRSPQSSITVLGGATWTREQYAPDSGRDPVINSAEGQLGIFLSTYRFKKLNFDLAAFLFPSMTTPGRVRFTFRSSLYYDITSRLYWSFNFNSSLDNSPPESAVGNDLVTTTNIGWKF